MKVKRLLMTGNASAQLSRHVEYAIELGASVMHVGYESISAARAPDGYTFVRIAEGESLAVFQRQELGPAYWEVVARESQRMAALVAEFRPDLCHVLGIDITLDLLIATGVRPLLVSAFGFLNHWIDGQAELIEADQCLTKIDALMVEPPLLAKVARGLLPDNVRVEQFAIGVDCRLFHPIDTKTRANWRRALKLAPESLVIFSPRGWARGYNHEYIVAAFAKALPSLPSPSTLLFVASGRYRDASKVLVYSDQVRHLAEKLGVAGHIRWLPGFPSGSMMTLYNAADLMISYASPDAFAHTILEVMACERPILVPDLPSYQDSVITEHCRLVAAKNVKALAEAIVDIVHDPPAAQALAAGRQAILAQYDKSVVKEQLAAIYDSVTKDIE